MLLDSGVHCIWRKVQISGPRHSTAFKRYLGKQRRIGKRGEYSGIGRMHQSRHIDRPRESIGKYNPQPELRKGFDFGYAPRRTGCDLRSYG